MVFTVECALFQCSLVTGLIIVGLKVSIVRFRLATEYAAHPSGVQLDGSRTVKSTYPLFNWKVQRFFMALPVVLSLKILSAESALVWKQGANQRCSSNPRTILVSSSLAEWAGVSDRFC